MSVTYEETMRDADEGPQPRDTRCEDYPCCGHELNDCDGSLYGSDESIKASVQRAWDTGHGYCDHEYGIFNCEDFEDDEDEWDEDDELAALWEAGELYVTDAPAGFHEALMEALNDD